MKFNDFQYTRPEIESFTTKFKSHLKDFEEANTVEAHSEYFELLNQLRSEYSSMYNICHIRHTINTKDKFYEAENAFFDLNNPTVESLINDFYKLLLESPFRKELEEKWGGQLFVIAELSLKTIRPTILEKLQDENKLASAYVKIKANAIINVGGKDYNLSSLLPVETSMDRNIRKKAAEAKWGFFEKHAPEVEVIYDKQVKLRHKIAVELGYKNFVELGYARMLRSDYTPEMVATFRDNVRKYIVPIANELYERQRKRIKVDTLTYFDEDFRFATGNPTPKGEPEWIIKKAEEMYGALSGDTKAFFDFMKQNGLMDLVSKDGKATGGYCTYIGKYKSPYIFSNFNGTSGDIDVLTHEAGHAFQVFSSRDLGIDEYNWPTYEACEIHSMSMEFFTWPFMNLFFEEDTDKYKFAHLSGALLFLPYGVAVDEFQHFVYENPDISMEARNAAWRRIEKKYLPHRNYADNSFLENGGYWQRQSHIFTKPFYYIDYTLAQICAFQFWIKDQHDHDTAWNNYLKLCKAGGSQSFLDLVKLAKLRSPFEEDCIKEVVNHVKEVLNKVDDSVF